MNSHENNLITQRSYAMRLDHLDHDYCPCCGMGKDIFFESTKSKQAIISKYACGSSSDFLDDAKGRHFFLRTSAACEEIKRLKTVIVDALSLTDEMQSVVSQMENNQQENDG